ncbi:hypothetical protein ACFQLX_19925 [Streptomyces polyrhachis]|uniref:Uncharacterized protein n=1 Tax=Streptomyces polyrhachis TaxID=1282885 RepID=A0ABW2GLN2_9ACTN
MTTTLSLTAAPTKLHAELVVPPGDQYEDEPRLILQWLPAPPGSSALTASVTLTEDPDVTLWSRAQQIKATTIPVSSWARSANMLTATHPDIYGNTPSN